METVQIELAVWPLVLVILLLQMIALVWFVKNHIRLTRARDHWKRERDIQFYKNNLPNKENN